MHDGEALWRLIRKHVEHMTRLDARLVALPESGVQQVGMVRHEDFGHSVIADRIPDFAARPMS